MTNFLKDQIDTLVQLQKIELEINSIKFMLANVYKRIDLLDAELKTCEQDLETESERTDVLKKKYREQEREVQYNLSLIRKSEIKLNAVKTNKEYQSVLKEIEDLKHKNSNIEDEMISYLDTVEAAELSLASKREHLSRVHQEINSQKEGIQQEAKQNQKRLAELEDMQKAIPQNIKSGLIEKYKHIQGKHSGGVAIVSVENAVCNGCNVNIPPQMYNELQRFDRLMFCPNCQRIIYWGVR